MNVPNVRCYQFSGKSTKQQGFTYPIDMQHPCNIPATSGK
ncbi:hypothetical protein CAter10_0152 [Collimonas arenae]|nr:hypothetical protein CAter10_0152 [Collimonas arenae]